MALFDTTAQFPRSPNPGATVEFTAYIRGGDIKAGELCQFEVDSGDAAVTHSLGYGEASNPMSNLIKSVVAEGLATQALWTIYAVAAEDISDDNEGKFYLRGDIPLAWDAASDAAGSGGTGGETAGRCGLVDTNAQRVIAILRETSVLYVSGTASTRTQCYFDGVYGFGQFNA